MTLFVFVVLGANIPFDDLGEHFLPALAVLAALMLLALALRRAASPVVAALRDASTAATKAEPTPILGAP